MPKVFIDENDKLCDRLAVWVYGQMRVRRITQQQMADELGITQQAFGKKLRRRQFSYRDFLTIVAYFRPETSELAWLVGKGS